MKGLVTASAVFDRWRSFRRPRSVKRWEARGRPAPPPADVKHSFLITYAAEYNLCVFVETGTFWGDTVAAMRQHFGEVISIELAPHLARHARRRFALSRRVTTIEGDSARTLVEVVSGLSSPTLFWLDGHDSGGVTAATEPLWDELAAIMQAPSGSVVLIDDARMLTGPPRMTVEEIGLVTQERFLMTVRDDVIRLTPQPSKAST